MQTPSYVYIMASGRNGTIYIGSTDDLVRRAYEHRNGVIDGFTKRYGCEIWSGTRNILNSLPLASVSGR